MAEIIVIMNQKGGVGKTTTAISLAAGFHYMGGRVLTIDIDPQGHLSKFSNCERSGRPTILELLNNKVTFKEAVQHVSYGDTLSSSAALNEFQMILAAKASAPFVIRKLLEQIKDKYDYIIIDCPPAKNQLTVAALVAADKVIIPTEPEYFAADGVTLMLSDIIQDVKDNYNPNLKVEGFLIVKRLKEFGSLQPARDKGVKSAQQDKITPDYCL
jgi:chromosome partitioning protein